MTTAFGYRLRSRNDCNSIGLLVFNVMTIASECLVDCP